jgi:hypothetical protein
MEMTWLALIAAMFVIMLALVLGCERLSSKK